MYTEISQQQQHIAEQKLNERMNLWHFTPLEQSAVFYDIGIETKTVRKPCFFDRCNTPAVIIKQENFFAWAIKGFTNYSQKKFGILTYNKENECRIFYPNEEITKLRQIINDDEIVKILFGAKI